jgi:hypothetical protein
MLRDSDPGPRVAVGVSGAGKTHSVRAGVYGAARAGVPVIALDIPKEWLEVPTDLAKSTALVATVPDAIKAVNDGKTLAIVRIKATQGASAAIAAAEWATDRREKAKELPERALSGIAIPEAHHVFPLNKPMPGPLAEIVLQWRHVRCALWCDSQRFALLGRALREQARETRLFACGPGDLKDLYETGGDELVAAIREAVSRFGGGEGDPKSEPGWHVRLGPSRLGPYELVRV